MLTAEESERERLHKEPLPKDDQHLDETPTIPNPAVVNQEQLQALQDEVNGLRHTLMEMRSKEPSAEKMLSGAIKALAGLALSSDNLISYKQMCSYLFKD